MAATRKPPRKAKRQPSAPPAQLDAREQFELLTSEMPMGFALHRMIFDKRGIPKDYIWLKLNPAFERLTGLTRGMVLGKRARAVLPKLERHWIDTFGRVTKTGKPVTFINFAKELGKYFEVRAYRPYEGHFAVLFTDITDQVRRQEERAKSQRLESLGILAGGIAHDFNNILTGILGNLSLAGTMADVSGELGSILKETEHAASSARGLTQQLLTFAKGGSPVVKLIEAGSLIRETVTFASRGSRSRCRFSLAKNLWAVKADPDQLSQVLHNLTLNAVQAMAQGGMINVSAANVVLREGEVPPLSGGRFIKLSVKDRGHGIPRSQLAKVFDPYFSTKAQGRGLGLATCQSIVRRHSGHITAESSPRRGTTFSVFLPAAPEGSIPGRKRPAVPRRGTGRVLIMDDDVFVVQPLRRILNMLGYRAKAVKDGKTALAAYREAERAGRGFSAVIMDLTIPGGMGGKEAVKNLKRSHPDAKVLVSSGYSTDPIMSDYSTYGFDGVLTKPYTVEDLAETLERLCGPSPSSK